MFDQTADNPPDTGTEPAPPADTTSALPDDNLDDNEDAAQTETDLPTDPDEIEEELEGLKLKGKKEALEKLKAERLMHQDYTRKTMSHAEERKAFEAQRQEFQRVAQTHQQMQQESAQLWAVDSRLQQLQAVNLHHLSQQDPQQAQALLIEMQQLQGHRGQLVQNLTQKQQMMQQAEQRERAKLASDAQAFLMRELKDWSPAKDAELEGYARSMGINTQQLGNFLLSNPAIALALDKASKWDKLAKDRATKPKTEPPPKPVTRVSGAAASNTKSPSDMSPAEYAEWRAKRKSRTR